MTITLKTFRTKYDSRTNLSKEKEFVDKHVVVLVPDPADNEDTVFTGSKIKSDNNKKDSHGYTPEQSAKVYESKLNKIKESVTAFYTERNEILSEDILLQLSENILNELEDILDEGSKESHITQHPDKHLGEEDEIDESVEKELGANRKMSKSMANGMRPGYGTAFYAPDSGNKENGTVKSNDGKEVTIDHDDGKTTVYTIDEDTLDELSKSTLGRYIKSASIDMADAANKNGSATEHRAAKNNYSKSDLITIKHNSKKEVKRRDGIDKAVNKLTKEDTLDELSYEKKDQYFTKAATDRGLADKEGDTKRLEKRDKGLSKVVYNKKNESIISKVLDKYLPEDTFSKKERIFSELVGLSESHYKIIASLYESLDDENKLLVLEYIEIKEINEVLDFALSNREFIEPLSEDCWKGYKQLGMKKKNKKEVPNCVKEDTLDEASIDSDTAFDKLKALGAKKIYTISSGILYTHKDKEYKLPHKDTKYAKRYVRGSDMLSHSSKFNESLDEKTLTPNEKDKVKEIADAIEKKSPDMPDGIRYAIATAKAKKIAEDTLDELSVYTHKAYIKKALKSGEKNWAKMDKEEDKAMSTDGYKYPDKQDKHIANARHFSLKAMNRDKGVVQARSKIAEEFEGTSSLSIKSKTNKPLENKTGLSVGDKVSAKTNSNIDYHRKGEVTKLEGERVHIKDHEGKSFVSHINNVKMNEDTLNELDNKTVNSYLSKANDEKDGYKDYSDKDAKDRVVRRTKGLDTAARLLKKNQGDTSK